MSLTLISQCELRKKSYKPGLNAKKVRRKREEILIQIRKDKREHNLSKKRSGLQPQQQYEYAILKSQLPAMASAVWSDDPSLQLEATTQFGNFLSTRENHNIDEVIKSGVVPRFIQFLTSHKYPALQFEASWALTRIASGTSQHARVLIDHGAVPLLVHLLIRSPDDDVREQAVLALGNLADHSPEFRDLVLRHSALRPLLAELNQQATLSMMRAATWTLYNLCYGEPQVALEQITPALPVLQRLVHSNDEEVLTDACWALSGLTAGMEYIVQCVVESGVCPTLIQLLDHPSAAVVLPALRAVGNIIKRGSEHTQMLIDNQLLPRLLTLFTNDDREKSVKQEACWIISNITADDKVRIQAVIDANIIPVLVEFLRSAEFDVKKEAGWAISNVTFGGSHEQVKSLINEGCIKPLCDLLDCSDPKVVKSVCLGGLDNILRVGELEKEQGNTSGNNLCAQVISEAGGLEKLEKLLNHKNNAIHDKALKIIESFWRDHDGDDYQRTFG